MASSRQQEIFTGFCPICCIPWSQVCQGGESAVRNNKDTCTTHYMCARCYAEIVANNNKCPHCREDLVEWVDATTVAKEEAPPISKGRSRNKLAVIKQQASSNHIDAFTCGICGKGFKSTGSLSNHRKRHFPDEYQTFYCETCLKRFYTKRDLDRHQKKAH